MNGITHFYSDPHFGHANVIEYSNRPFANVDKMDNELILRYNDNVGHHDVVLWLGDCFLCPVEQAQDIMSYLNGTKLLVRGNHDRSAAAMARIGFSVVADQMTLHIADRKVIAAHRPYAGVMSPEDEAGSRNPEPPAPLRAKGQVLLHGHTHDKRKRRDNMIHLGVDAWDYRPALFAEVETLVREIGGSH